MSETTELIAKQIMNGNINKKTWGELFFNVKVYGAKGDGITDDTQAIQKTIDATIDAGGKAILFPHGTYKVTALTKLDQVILFGDNASFVGISEFINQIGTIPSTDFYKNVKDYGATGNGTVDDTLSFQSAINAVLVSGAVLFVPAGTYRISDTINIPSSMTIIGEGATFAGTTILKFYMDGKPLTQPAVKINSADSVHIEGLYILNMGTEKRVGVHIDGGTTNPDLNSFIRCERMFSLGWSKCFAVNNTWIVTFRDCYAGRDGDTYGYYVNGGTVTTVHFDHCYATSCVHNYYVILAYYTTLTACASDFAKGAGYRFEAANAVAMTGCGCEGAASTAIDVYASTLTINGFTSVGDGTDTDINFASMLTAQNSSRVFARGFHEINRPTTDFKISSIALGSDVFGEYASSGKELLGIAYPKNGRFLFNGQAYTTGTPTGIGWLTSDIGKLVHESNPVEAGTTPNKYIKLGYVRKTTGDGNVLNTDWYEVRTLTGN